uniref:Uncharacterized protein n=1 Tax=Timema monikensis TaxID=170555 RepID=A0A7R9E3K3_9NEOP|nr:unnamed protein product [Timema monikensis]
MDKANETIAKDADLLKRKRETIEDKKVPAKKQKEAVGKSVGTVKVVSVTSPGKTTKALALKKVGQTSGDKKDVPGKNQPRSPVYSNKTDLEKQEYLTRCLKKLTVTLKNSYYQYRRWSEKNRKDGFICPVVDFALSGQKTLYHRCMLYAGVDKNTRKLILGIRRQMFVVVPNLLNFVPPVAKTIKACQDLVQMVGKPIFDETKGNGFWRSILVRCNNAGDVLVQVDLHATSRKAADAVFKEMKSVMIEFFGTGVGKDCNVKSLYLKIVLKDLQCIKGARHIEETVGGMKVKLYPHSYFNTGTTAMKALGEVLAAVAKREGTTEVLEVGCGTGIIGQMLSKVGCSCSELPNTREGQGGYSHGVSSQASFTDRAAAAHSKEVYGIDTESAVEDALENADMNGIKNCYYFGGNTVVGLCEVSKLLSASSNALAIVNSTGADVLSGANVLKEVCQMAGIKTLAYVSVFSKRCWVNMLELLKPQDTKPTFSFLPYYMIPIDFGLHSYSAIVVMKHIEKNFVSELYDLPNSISLKDIYKKETGVKKNLTLNVNKAIKMGDKTKVRASLTKLREADKERFSVARKPLWTAKTALLKAKNTVNTKLLSRQRIEFGEARRKERGMLADSKRDIRVWEREGGDFRKPAIDRGPRSQYTGHSLGRSRGSTDHRSRSKERAGGIFRGHGHYPRDRPHSRDRGKISRERDINKHTAPTRKDWNDEAYMNVVYRNNESIIEQDPKRNVWVREDGLITAVVEGADGKITDTKLGYNDGVQDLRSLLHKAPNVEAQYSHEVDSWGNVISHKDGDLRTFLQVKRTSHQHPQASDTALFVGDKEDNRMFVGNNDQQQLLHSGQFDTHFGKEFPPARHDAVQENLDLREVLQDKRIQLYDSPTFDRTNRMDFHYPHATETKGPVKLIDKPSQDLRTILDRGQHQISEIFSKERESVYNALKINLATNIKINSKRKKRGSRGTKAGRGRQKGPELWSPSNTRMGDNCSNYDQPSSVVAGDQNIKVQPEDNSFRQSVSHPHDTQDKGMSAYLTSPRDNRKNIYSPNFGNIRGTGIERNPDNSPFQRHSAHMFDSASQPVNKIVQANLDTRDTRINYRDGDNRSNSRDISFHGGGNSSRDRKSAPDIATRENIRTKGEDIDNFHRGYGSLDKERDNLKRIDTREVRTNPRDLDLHISKPNIPGADTLDSRASGVNAVERYDRPDFRDSDMKDLRGNRNVDATRNLFGQNVDSRDNKFKEALSVSSSKSQNRTNVHNFDHGSNRSHGLEVAETQEHNKNRKFGNSQSVSTREGVNFRGHNTPHNFGTIRQDNPAWYNGPQENNSILTKHDIHNNRPKQTVGIIDRASHGNMEAQRYNPPARNTDSLRFDPPARNTDSHRFDPPARNTDSHRFDPPAHNTGALRFDPPARNTDSLRYEPPAHNTDSLRFDPLTHNTDYQRYEPPDCNTDSLRFNPPARNTDAVRFDPPARNTNSQRFNPPAHSTDYLRFDPPAHNTDSLQFEPLTRNTDSLRFNPPTRNTDALRFDPPARNTDALRFDPPARNTDALRFDPPAHNTDALRFDPPALNTDALRFDPPARNTDSLRFDPPGHNTDSLQYGHLARSTDSQRFDRSAQILNSQGNMTSEYNDKRALGGVIKTRAPLDEKTRVQNQNRQDVGRPLWGDSELGAQARQLRSDLGAFGDKPSLSSDGRRYSSSDRKTNMTSRRGEDLHSRTGHRGSVESRVRSSATSLNASRRPDVGGDMKWKMSHRESRREDADKTWSSTHRETLTRDGTYGNLSGSASDRYRLAETTATGRATMNQLLRRPGEIDATMNVSPSQQLLLPKESALFSKPFVRSSPNRSSFARTTNVLQSAEGVNNAGSGSYTAGVPATGLLQHLGAGALFGVFSSLNPQSNWASGGGPTNRLDSESASRGRTYR